MKKKKFIKKELENISEEVNDILMIFQENPKDCPLEIKDCLLSILNSVSNIDKAINKNEKRT